MANPTHFLVSAIRTTATRLENGDSYMWAHMGRCNCGHLTQTLTGLSAEEIHRRAMSRHGDWTEQTEHFEPYCPHTGFNLDYLMNALVEAGLYPTDIRDLEYLSNRDVLKRLPGGFRYLKRSCREDVILYLKTWADLLESRIRPEAVDSTADLGFKVMTTA